MSEKCFEGMVSASMRSPLVVTAFRGQSQDCIYIEGSI